jgi:hypothetical protein
MGPYKSAPLTPVPNQFNPVSTIKSLLLKILFNIVFPAMLKLSK